MRNVLIGLAGGLLVSLVLVPGCTAGDLTPGQAAGGFLLLGGFGALFGLAIAAAEWLGGNERRAGEMFGISQRRRIAAAWASLSDVLPRLDGREIDRVGRSWFVSGTSRTTGRDRVFRADFVEPDGIRFVDTADPDRDFAAEAGYERHREDGAADARDDKWARGDAAREEGDR